jgi:hypothetical protein
MYRKKKSHFLSPFESGNSFPLVLCERHIFTLKASLVIDMISAFYSSCKFSFHLSVIFKQATLTIFQTGFFSESTLASIVLSQEESNRKRKMLMDNGGSAG